MRKLHAMLITAGIFGLELTIAVTIGFVIALIVLLVFP